MDRATYIKKIHSENTIELLNVPQNIQAYQYNANRFFEEIVSEMLHYAKTYKVSNAAAIYDFDFPVHNENLKKLEEKGFLKTVERK